MKTAKIEVYHVHGTNGDYRGRVIYRGKTLVEFDRSVVLNWSSLKSGLVDKCKAWAIVQGFTHYKTEVAE